MPDSVPATPATLLRSTCLGVVVLHTAFLVVTTLETSHYTGDDVVAFHDARALSFVDHLTKPIDVHAVPLHRAVSYAVAWLAPMQFPVGVALLALVHAMSLVALYRALARLAPSPFVPAVVAAYASHVYLGSLFIWWTAGLHRLPYLCLSAMALLAFARFREESSFRRGLLVLLPHAASLGFFEKALLFPCVLLSIELCLYRRTTARTRARSLALVLSAFTVSAAYYALSRLLVEDEWHALMRDVPFLVEHTRLSWLMLLRSAVGASYDGTWLALGISGTVIALTLARAGWNAVVWLLAGSVVSVQVLVTGLSEPRSRTWGHLLSVFSHRYYTEVFFVLLIFLALALREACDPLPKTARGPSGERGAPGAAARRARGMAWVSAGLTSAVALTLSLASAREWVRLTASLYTYAPVVKRYRDRVAHDVRTLEQAGAPLVFVDGVVPRSVDPLGGFTARHSLMLTAMGKQARFTRAGAGVYRITDSGAIVPAWQAPLPLHARR